tara:strand:- start:1146 stop:1982 length:837 start_codon:yes stop_codon:yes gene_type:complete
MIIWLASYPKSGNTWVRSLLSAYYYSENGNFSFELLKKIDQYPQKKYFDVKINKPGEINSYWDISQQKIISKKKIKILKTHNCLLALNGKNFTMPQYTLGIIYVVRDPRNVITSLKNHYDLDYEQSLNFMMNEKKYIFNSLRNRDFADFHFLSSWSNHYKSWINNNLFRRIVVKYEDLEKDTFKTLKNLIRYTNNLSKVNEKIDDVKINNCIKTTNFEILKQKEIKEGFIENVYSSKTKNKINFFHLGSKNKWRKVLPKKLHNKINNIFREDLKNLKY